jgi:RNA polymerase sigma factor (sigma-70 family)
MTDAELVPLAANGNADAAETLYRKYHHLAVNVARGCLPADRIDRAEDCGQDVFLWLLQGRWRLDSRAVSRTGELFGFVKVLARWAAMKQGHRLVDEHASIEPDEQWIPAGEVAAAEATGPNPEAALLRKERLQHLGRAFQTLRPHLRRVAKLRYFDGLGSHAIAAAVGVQANTMFGYFYQVRNHLRRELFDVYTLPSDSLSGYMRVDKPGRWGRTEVL